MRCWKPGRCCTYEKMTIVWQFANCNCHLVMADDIHQVFHLMMICYAEEDWFPILLVGFCTKGSPTSLPSTVTRLRLAMGSHLLKGRWYSAADEGERPGRKQDDQGKLWSTEAYSKFAILWATMGRVSSRGLDVIVVARPSIEQNAGQNTRLKRRRSGG